MKKILAVASLSLAVAGFAYASGHESVGAKLIQNLSKNQLKTLKSFEGPMGLEGFVVEAPNGQKNIFYTSKDGKYLISGNIVEMGQDNKPVNLTQQFYTKYVTSKMAYNALKDISKVKAVMDSKNDKAPVLYVLWDPNCAYCHLLYKELRPMIDSGKVQVSWIPVAIRPNSENKTAQILAAKNNAEAIKLMEQDESKFSMEKEQGKLKGIKKDKANESAFNAVKENTKFFIENNFIGTPVILYHTKANLPKMVQGYLPQKALTKLLENVSSKQAS